MKNVEKYLYILTHCIADSAVIFRGIMGEDDKDEDGDVDEEWKV